MGDSDFSLEDFVNDEKQIDMPNGRIPKARKTTEPNSNSVIMIKKYQVVSDKMVERRIGRMPNGLDD